MEALREWLQAEVGRTTKLAEAINVTPGAIMQWAKVPAERLNDVHHATGIARETLRPDLFGPPRKAPPHYRRGIPSGRKKIQTVIS